MQQILEAVVKAVGIGPDAVPVTLKIRTGWDREHKNAIEIARLAENSGISMLTVHGRTRATYITVKQSTKPLLQSKVM